MKKLAGPLCVIIGGPNGAGKSTLASELIPKGVEYIDPDLTAQRLRSEGARNADVKAGRILLARINERFEARLSFAIETTLAGRSLLRSIEKLKSVGYRLHLIYVGLPDPDLAVQRVRFRIQAGGHGIPEETIRRRFRSGLVNLVNKYLPRADTWSVYYNVISGEPHLIAERKAGGRTTVYDPEVWEELQHGASKSDEPDEES